MDGTGDGLRWRCVFYDHQDGGFNTSRAFGYLIGERTHGLTPNEEQNKSEWSKQARSNQKLTGSIHDGISKVLGQDFLILRYMYMMVRDQLQALCLFVAHVFEPSDAQDGS